VVVIVLAWPVGSWLEYREVHFSGKGMPDVVYLVAGSRDQPRRIDAVVRTMDNLLGAQPGAGLGMPLILVGNDRLKGRWSPEDQRNLAVGEWSVRHLEDKVGKLVGRGDSGGHRDLRIELVPGTIVGTDSEMRVLVRRLDSQAGVRRLVVVTSPFHIRRLIGRLRYHLSGDMEVWAVPAAGKWTDRAPWTVMMEILKMTRDRIFYS